MKYDVVIVGTGLGGENMVLKLSKFNIYGLLIEKEILPCEKLCEEAMPS